MASPMPVDEISARIANVNPRKAVVATPTDAADPTMAERMVPKLAAVVVKVVRSVASWLTR